MKGHALLEHQVPPGGGDCPAGDCLGGDCAGPIARQRSSERQPPALAPFGLLEPPHSNSATPVPGHASADLQAPQPAILQAALQGQCQLAHETSINEYEIEEPLGARVRAFFSRLLAFTGPGWLMSIAYVDPGNLEADLQCGAQFGYMLLWALLASTFAGLCMQMVAARLGCATRRHLAEHCREHYPPVMRVVLWGLTELAIIGSDIQEVIGCSIGLFILFDLHLVKGVVVTAAAAFGFLFLERLGTRPLELFFGALIAVLAATMGRLFVEIDPDKNAILDGMFVPKLPSSAVQQVVGMVGCVIMPHNLFLHSALVQSRVIEAGEEAEAVTLFTIESSAAIVTSLLINTAVVAVFAKGFFGKEEADSIGLANAGTYLGAKYGGALRIIWGLGLVAAGQSSTMTGAYAGQWVMQGYLQLKVKPWKRALITRSMALMPTLFVAFIFGDKTHALDLLNQYLNILQSLVLPFAVVPLLIFAGSRPIMGELCLSWPSLLLGWAAASAVMAANIYLLLEQFSGESGASVMLAFFLIAYLVLVIVVAVVGRRATSD